MHEQQKKKIAYEYKGEKESSMQLQVSPGSHYVFVSGFLLESKQEKQ